MSTYIERLFSENDEVAILKGIIKYKNKKGTNPFEAMSDFHVFLKKYITVDVTLRQLRDKIRKLKIKFIKNVKKTKNADENKVLLNFHDRKCFKLSKKIWGSEEHVMRGVHVVKNKLSDVEVKRDVVENVKISRSLNDVDGTLSKYPFLNASLKYFAGFDIEFLKDGLRLMSESELNALEEKWKRLNEEELKLHKMRMDLIEKQTKVIIDAIKSSMT